MVLVFGSKINLVLVWVSKLTCFLCADRIWLGFRAGVD